MPSAFTKRFLSPVVRPIAFIVSLGLILLSALLTLLLSYGVNSQVVDITRNFELRSQVGRITRIAYNLEMSRRGYLLTLDDAYFERYQRALVEIDQTLADLSSITDDNAQQNASIEQIKALVARTRDDVRETVDLAKAGKVQEAIERVRDNEGRVLMGQLVDTVTQFVATEEQELSARNAYIDRMRFLLTVAAIVALASAVVLGFLLFSRAQRAVRLLFEGQSALMSEKELLEARVRERTVELEQERAVAERERKRVELLLQDSNHRIGNSLATVSSLLGLQLRQTRSDEARAALSAARDRVQTVSTAHRRLRLGEDMESTRIDEFLETVIEDIRHSIGADQNIQFRTDFAPLDLKSRDVTTIGIILGELITNAVKHAFTGLPEGLITIRFWLDNESNAPVLVVEDNGIGWQKHNAGSSKENGGLGMLVIEQLCMQFGSKPIYTALETGSGTKVIVRLLSLAEDQQKQAAEGME
ncbi:sensor histidine kinase [Brucella gallinifaecis]|uniref:histidine kinase n=1 Tax=Brucella gallinifaecis TaxID=215590 RepID=A0A502BIK3_9HYPH|nr:CHASE3 domain-containing protein [Brucella gallinifaecis]TPF73984.1 histidine kinase [Brucella gallinifaecis]